ncbi:Rubisco LSMT substrate-binding, putative [Angomonas deanei]|uniref:Rubisco LSMT substrate-binding, putative n=1 Tax=Angomonas deanei TaxID=59799 RepID=A0A7G2CGX1_9TRYP|nr:Rubisco LSMT substrate-binding, putative [Angomonas deanei]
MEEKGPFVALSLQTELNIVDTIEQTVHSIEELFSTTLEEDEAELKDLTDQNSDSKENVNFVLCLRLRIGLKRIAQRTLAYCEEERRKLSA